MDLEHKHACILGSFLPGKEGLLFFANRFSRGIYMLKVSQGGILQMRD